MRNTQSTQVLVDFDSTFRAEGPIILCGVDEAGRGPLAGPVVASAVIFDGSTIIEGVCDSKKLSPDKREELYFEITSKALCWNVGICSHTKIDEINIYHANILAMKKAIKGLGIRPELVLVDGNFFRHRRYKYLNIIKGDEKSFSIAAASIIAKVTRDRIMCRMEKKYPNYEFSHHKGYTTRKHVEEIKANGYCEIHRRTFLAKGLKELEIVEEEKLPWE